MLAALQGLLEVVMTGMVLVGTMMERVTTGSMPIKELGVRNKEGRKAIRRIRAKQYCLATAPIMAEHHMLESKCNKEQQKVGFQGKVSTWTLARLTGRSKTRNAWRHMHKQRKTLSDRGANRAQIMQEACKRMNDITA